MDIQPRHAHITAQLEWDLENMEETGFISNSSQLNIHWDSDERVAFMIDDSAVNELLDQVTILNYFFVTNSKVEQVQYLWYHL